MSERFCYWSIGDGPYGRMLATMVASARQAGVEEDFHLWTDRPIAGAVCHELPEEFDKHLYLFKFEILLREVAGLDYDYYVFLDADCYFVRHPGNVLRTLHGAPIHVCLESDCTDPRNTRLDWWGCPLERFVELMRSQGVRSRKIFNTNAGFWIVKRDVIPTFHSLAMSFWQHCSQQGFQFTEEAPLAYVGQMLTGNPYLHTLPQHPDLWASDWTGVFADRLPEDATWQFQDYMNQLPTTVNPAIVHAMRSKAALIQTVVDVNDESPATE